MTWHDITMYDLTTSLTRSARGTTTPWNAWEAWDFHPHPPQLRSSTVFRWNNIHQPTINPFTAPARWKALAYTNACKEYIWWSYNKSTFSAEHFVRSCFTCLWGGGDIIISSLALLLVVFRVTIIGRFLGEDAASMAVEGLIINFKEQNSSVMGNTVHRATDYRVNIHIAKRSWGQMMRQLYSVLCWGQMMRQLYSALCWGQMMRKLYSVSHNLNVCTQRTSAKLHESIIVYT